MSQVPDEILREAADPSTSPLRLHEIAASAPGTHAVIAANPTAYPELLEWLRQVGDPFTQQVLTYRDQGYTGAYAYENAWRAYQAASQPPQDTPTQDDAQPQQPQAAPLTPATDVEATTPLSAADAEQTSVVSPSDEEPTAVIPPAVDAALARAGEVEGAAAAAATSIPPAAADPTQPLARPDTPTFTPDPWPTAEVAPVTRHSLREVATPHQGIERPPAYAPTSTSGYQSPQAGPQQAASKKPVGLIILAVLLALVLIGLTVSFFLLFERPDNLGAGERSTISSSQSGREGTATPTPQPTETETEDSKELDDEIRYPAPPDAAQSSNFHMPSDNINCQLGDSDVRCTIFEKSFGDCGNEPLTIILTDDEAHQTCSSSKAVLSGAGGVLVYDTTTTAGNYACTSSTSGVKCWDMRTGRGFFLAREDAHTTHE